MADTQDKFAALRLFREVLGLGETARAEALKAAAPEVRDEVERLLRLEAEGESRFGADDDTVMAASTLTTSSADTYTGQTMRSTRELRVDDELGRGGMGLVLRVEDESLSRQLAMKVMRRERFVGPVTDTVAVARFLEEAQVTAQLDHPGIVPVHDLGHDDDGNVFFTMQLVRGRELGEVFSKARSQVDGWNLPRAIGVLVKVCQALAYAHEKGVVHRDLKPANVMVGRFGEVYVMDWGLAKVRGRTDQFDLRIREASSADDSLVRSKRQQEAARDPETPLITMDGTVMGTPTYMAPEQANGKLELIDARSDVYSVGAMLYELLTGQRPYASSGDETPYTVLSLATSRPPAPVERLAPDVPPELLAICSKAMARERDARYATSANFAEDLQAYLDGRVVRAYRTGAVAELRSWVRRNRLAASAIVCAVLAVSIGLAVVAWMQSRAARGRAVEAALFQVLDLHDRATEESTPAIPARLGDMDRWLADVRALGENISVWVDDELSGEPRPAQLLDEYARLTDTNQRFSPLSLVTRRREFARSLATEVTPDWQAAIDSIRRSAVYGGLDLSVQTGLRPLQEDPQSGLWEFAHLESGTPPRVVGDAYEILPETGIVLVLIPGGRVQLGVAREVDPSAEEDEAPREVEVTPFFLSKYEVTQTQWARFRETQPSDYFAGRNVSGVLMSPLHPVERTSWNEAHEFSAELGLRLPSSAEWESAALYREGVGWWLRKELLAELNGYLAYVKPSLEGRESRDDWGVHTVVTAGVPSPSGLFHVLGNVSEWCSDEWSREERGPVLRRHVRGGSWASAAAKLRVTDIQQNLETTRHADLGFRPARSIESP
ncbi:MAG: bifunctional serine/threonine-protein kinase/formylglycine-generating enzyme family protein [Planctomycetota bacterium]